MMSTKGRHLVIAMLILASCNKNNAASEENVEATDVSATSRAPASAEMIFCPIVSARVSKPDCEDLTAVQSQVTTGVGAFNVPNPMTRDETKAITLVVDRRTPEQIAAIEAQQGASNVEAANENTAEENLSANEVAPVDNETAAEENHAAPPPPPRPPPPAETDDGGPTPKQTVSQLEGKTETITPKVGRFMSADLSGEGFKVEALGPAFQEIPLGERATWQWKVTPTEGGTHSLTLKTVVEGVVGNKHYPLSRTQTIKTVTVKVSAGGWLADKIAQATRGLNLLYTLLVALGLVVTATIGVWRPWKNRNKV